MIEIQLRPGINIGETREGTDSRHQYHRQRVVIVSAVGERIQKTRAQVRLPVNADHPLDVIQDDSRKDQAENEE